MNRQEALQSLLAKVEAGERPWREPHDNDTLGWLETVCVLKAFDGSLDAALALHEAVLPEWKISLTTHRLGMGEAEIWQDPTDPKAKYYQGRCKGNSSRAALIAILKALIAMEAE